MLHTFGECESGALGLLSGPLLYLQCAHKALGKRSVAVAVERLLFHMTDFPNCSKINLWNQRKAVAAAGWRGLWSSQRRRVCLWGFRHVWCSVWGRPGDLENLQISPSCVPVNQNCERRQMTVSCLWMKTIRVKKEKEKPLLTRKRQRVAWRIRKNKNFLEICCHFGQSEPSMHLSAPVFLRCVLQCEHACYFKNMQEYLTIKWLPLFKH